MQCVHLSHQPLLPPPAPPLQASAKDVAAAAYALAGLNSRSDRRLWGKVFEAAAAVKGSWDPASLSAFMWAITSAKVGGLLGGWGGAQACGTPSSLLA